MFSNIFAHCAALIYLPWFGECITNILMFFFSISYNFFTGWGQIQDFFWGRERGWWTDNPIFKNWTKMYCMHVLERVRTAYGTCMSVTHTAVLSGVRNTFVSKMQPRSHWKSHEFKLRCYVKIYNKIDVLLSWCWRLNLHSRGSRSRRCRWRKVHKAPCTRVGKNQLFLGFSGVHLF